MNRATANQIAILVTPYAMLTAALAFVLSYGSVVAATIFAITAYPLLAWNQRLRRTMAIAARRIDAIGVSTAPASSLEGGLDGIEQRLQIVGHRLQGAHPVSGLPVREALLARMAADQAGLLGALAFADFDRLTAFDPSLADRVFATSAARLRKMLPEQRFIAQVDRGQIGLWFDGGSEADARAELDAIAYALGEEIDDDGRRIVPQIKVRLTHYDAAQDVDAGAFLARTLASFALSGKAADATSERDVADYALLARERYEIEQDLRHAIAQNELRLVFQPLIDAGRGAVCGAEALIRWDHPERGAVPPTRFIPIMESMGLASEIGLWALNAAVRAAHDWSAQGLGALRVAVNVSGLQLERDDLPILVQRTLQRHGVSAGALEIELTESVATSDADHCRRIFQELRAMGVKLAVDDFGTGYSGFSSLRTLAFDKIKIDREFVTDVDHRRDGQAICQSIIALGRGLGICVLAEGVERHAEFEWLRRNGCRHFQGYYFGRPMEAAAFTAFVRDPAGLTELLRPGTRSRHIEERLRA